MDTDPTQDTVPISTVRRTPSSPLGRFIRSVPGAFLILFLVLGGVLAVAAVGGYRAGIAEHDRAAATAQFAELTRQYQLGIEDMDAGRYTLAVERFEFILAIDPNFPGAADRLAEARASATPSPVAATLVPTPIVTADPQTAPKLFAEAQAAFEAKDWDTTIQKINALRLADPAYEPSAVRNMLYNSFRNRGIDSINAGKLELGLTDLDQASKIGALDTEAQQYQQWATIYMNGISYWGLNWPRTIETFQLLYTIAPYFRDTITRLHDAHLAYAKQLDTGGDPCSAVAEYAAALEMQFDQTVEDKRLAAETACALGTATPDGTLTPFPTPDGTLTPFATVDLSVTPTETPVPTPAATPTLTP
ncbi:MAG: hypothetical protein AAB382_06260 [Chloroflexota bacterium]|mgnify:FL=1